MNTGARVTYAMARDEELPSHFGVLHGKNLTPHRAVWTLAAISAVIGIFAVLFYLDGPAVSDVAAMQTTVDGIRSQNSAWYSFGVFDAATMKAFPNSLLIVTLLSNFGTFLLYMLTNLAAIVAFVEHHTFNTFKHVVIPVFGLVANLVCMLFYLIGPFMVTGMSLKEPYIALGLAALWGLWGLGYFMFASKAKGKPAMVSQEAAKQAAVPT
jgi:amino acid transporter